MHTFEASLEVNLIDSQLKHYKAYLYFFHFIDLQLYLNQMKDGEKDDKQNIIKNGGGFFGATAN